MPYKYGLKKLRIPREKDKRVKLSLEERDLIKKLYGEISQRKLAAMFGVSRRLIIFIGCPEKYQRNLEQRKARGGSSYYYDAEKHKEYMKRYRRSKQILYLKNELVKAKRRRKE